MTNSFASTSAIFDIPLDIRAYFDELLFKKGIPEEFRYEYETSMSLWLTKDDENRKRDRRLACQEGIYR